MQACVQFQSAAYLRSLVLTRTLRRRDDNDKVEDDNNEAEDKAEEEEELDKESDKDLDKEDDKDKDTKLVNLTIKREPYKPLEEEEGF